MAKRLDLLRSHLTVAPRPSPFVFAADGQGLAAYRQRGVRVDLAALRRAIDGELWEYPKQCQERACQSRILDNRLYHDLSRTQLKELYVRQILSYFQTVPYTLEEEETDTRKLVFWLSSLWTVNLALAIRLCVHLILYCDTIRMLGSEKHRQFVERAFSFQDYGSFCLTELAHGSNAAGIETTATFDLITREFELQSPASTSAKWWIGAVGQTANMAVVFAQLVISGINHGVHVFLVPIRDYTTHDALPGVTIGDCGPKGGCNGIDNGFLLFHKYRVGYDALLDRISHIAMDGKLKTNVKNKEKRFSTMLAGLVRARFGVSAGSLLSLRHGLTIATRFAANRQQFGPPGKAERPILDYQLTRWRITPHIANLFAAGSAIDLLRNLIERHKVALRDSPDGAEVAEIHALMSIVKPLCTWYSQRGLQECREVMGGHGYSAFATVAGMISDNDVNATWEGENNVLMQQTARFLMRNAQKILKGQKTESDYCSFITLDAGSSSGSAQFASRSDLRSNSDLLLALMTHRAQLLMRKAIIRMQANSAKSESGLDTWNNSQVFFLQPLAIAFGEMALTNEFARTAAGTRASHRETGDLVMRLVEIFVLTKVNADLGTFREDDFLSAEQGNLIKDYLLELVTDVGESAVRIMDAIASPDPLLGSPFAAENMYKQYTDLVEGAKDCYEKANWVPLLSDLRLAGKLATNSHRIV